MTQGEHREPCPAAVSSPGTIEATMDNGHRLQDDLQRAETQILELLIQFANASLALPDWSTPRDLTGLVEAAIRGRAGVVLPDVAGVEAFARAVQTATYGSEPALLRLLLSLAGGVREGGEVVIDCTQREASVTELAGANGKLLLSGLTVGHAANLAPQMFLPPDSLPAVVGPQRVALSDDYYFLNLLLEGDVRRWYDQALAVGVGLVCVRETTTRLKRYPKSAQVWAAVATDSLSELRSLFYRVAPGDQDSDTESGFNETLAKETAGLGALELAWKSLEGKFETVGASMRRDAIDEYRKSRRQRRSPDGRIRQLSAIEGADETLVPVADTRGFVRRPAGREAIARQGSAAERAAAIQLTLESLRTRDTADRGVVKLADSILRSPEMTVRERAMSLEITERTLLNWKKRLAEYFKPSD